MKQNKIKKLPVIINLMFQNKVEIKLSKLYLNLK